MKKDAKSERIEVFRDTMDWIENDVDLKSSIQKAKQNTKVYYEDEYPSFDKTNIKDEIITVTKHRSYEAAMLLRKENPDAKIAVMNFANAFCPGGGVTRGASAQEECLCRCSTLYPLLYRISLKKSFYDYHKKINSPKATDTLIYTEGVIICKSDEDFPKRMDKKDFVNVDVITIAAPDLRKFSNRYFNLIDGGLTLSDDELYAIHVQRAKHMLCVAAHKKADILVLGAFGCGAFQNDPSIVAKAYKDVLDQFPKVFKKIEFAIYCSPSDETNYIEFKKAL